MFDRTSGDHGKADFATPRQLKNAGWLGSQGVHLGETMDGQTLRHDGEEHILTVAQPGAGKTVGLVLPTLLTYRGSMVVTDPKAALVAQTAEARRKLGARVVILNPWADEIAEATGKRYGDTGFNPLRTLRAGDPAIIDNAEMMASLLCPTPPDARDSYFTDTGRAIITGCLLYLVHADGMPCNLPALYTLLRRTSDGWADLAASMADVEGIDLTEYAAEILSPLESPKQWAGVQGAMLAATSIYNPQKSLGRHVAKDDFNPADLKAEDLTVYIVIPSNRRDANKAWLGLVMAMCAEAVGRVGQSRRVLLLAEEFANLGYMPSITRAMAEYREAGLRCWLIVQNLHQLDRLYKRDGAQEIVNLCAVRQFFAVDDIDLASRLERTIGKRTIAQTSTSRARHEVFDKGNDTRSETGSPLLMAQDILNLPKHHQIITTSGNLPPVMARVRPFYTCQTLVNASAPNPYRKEPAQRLAAPYDEPKARNDNPFIPSLVCIGVGGLFVYMMATKGLIGSWTGFFAFWLMLSGGLWLFWKEATKDL